MTQTAKDVQTIKNFLQIDELVEAAHIESLFKKEQDPNDHDYNFKDRVLIGCIYKAGIIEGVRRERARKNKKSHHPND